jgi:hypothetical protein
MIAITFDIATFLSLVPANANAVMPGHWRSPKPETLSRHWLTRMVS